MAAGIEECTNNSGAISQLKASFKTSVIFGFLCLASSTGCAGKADIDPAPEGRDAHFPNHSDAETDGVPPWRVLEPLRWDETLKASPIPPHGRDALADTDLGLLPGAGFEAATGRCPHCPIPEAALWYFRDEVIAVPKTDWPISGQIPFATQRDSMPYPPLIWIAAPEIVEEAVLSEDGSSLHSPAGAVPLALTPKIPTNRAYPDHATLAYFRERALRVRGVTLLERGEPLFVARTIWPQDTRIEADALVLEPLRERETLATLVRAQGRRTLEFYDKRLLWEREPGQPRRWANRAVLALVLNGAQGDDDGAHGGHLGIATGWFGPQGEWGDWLVANFYPIEDKSDKGIITSLVPMDNFLMDINSGQAWYRPNYMLVAVFREPGLPRWVQAAMQEVFHRYYCQQIEYDRVRQNSTAMIVDTLKALGWNIPPAGVTSYVAGILAFPIGTLVQKSFAGGKEMFAAFATERTRAIPRVAFEAAGLDLLTLLKARGEPFPRPLTPFEQMLMNDVDALIFVRIPQVPSSRRFGTFPVESPLEYATRVPWKAEQRETALDAGKWHFPNDLLESCEPFR